MGIGAGAAAAIAAGVGAAGSIAGSAMQSGAVGAASKASQQQFQQQRNDLAPWREVGATASTATSDLLGLNGPEAAQAAMAQFQQSPGYQWQLDQGLRAVDAGAAASGLLRSGAALKAEQAFGSGLAAQEFGNYYQRLARLSEVGETAAAGGAATAAAAAQSGQNAANAQNSIIGDAAKGIGSTANQLLSNQDFRNWIGGGGGVSGNAISGYTVPNNFNIGAGTGIYPGTATF